MKNPRSCIVELWTSSQKSTSVVEPEVSGDLRHASIIGMTEARVTMETIAINVELCYDLCSQMTSILETQDS